MNTPRGFSRASALSVALVLAVALQAHATDFHATRSQHSRAYMAAAALVVHQPDAHFGYSRGLFGRGWTDVNQNGCGTRDDILRRDLRNITTSGSCKVLNGYLRDPYTGANIFFVRGGASEVDIDHVVALSNAWGSGADRWGFAKRVNLANDPLNLLAVGSSINREKGDANAAEWLPPARTFRCRYVARQVAVKRKYKLWVTSDERRAMLQVLGGCPKQNLPAH